MGAPLRAIVVKESLKSGALPPALCDFPGRSYAHELDRDWPVTIAEFLVPGERVPEVCFHLASELLPKRYYAHLVNDQMLYVVYPDCVIRISASDTAADERARVIGRLYGIPDSQMRFLEMFETDHPDAAEQGVK